MDISSLKAGTLKAWVPFLQKTRIQVRHVGRDEFKDLLEKTITREVIDGETKENFDNSAFNDLLCKAAVTDLEGFKEGEAPIPCTPELVALLVQKSSQFVTTVRSVCTDLDRIYTLTAEETKKK